MMRNERILIHLHLPKTAGTTLRTIADRNYSDGEIYTISKPYAEQGEELRDLPAQRKRQIKLLRGHMPFGLHEHFDKPADYFTVLRNPVERIISAYYYIRRTPTLPHYREVAGKNMTLEDFARCGLPQTYNQQTGLISGRLDNFTDALEIAKHNLSTHFIAVGICERFDETLLLLNKQVGWKRIFYHRQNVTKDRPARSEVPQTAIRLIEKRNALDMELYEFAWLKFDEALNAQGLFTEQVRHFQRMNRVYDKAGACVDVVRSAVPSRAKRFISRMVTRAEPS
jgi:hypothetical protein